MSDQTPEGEVSEDTADEAVEAEDVVVDYAELDEDALLARHAELSEQIEALKSEPRTLDRAQQINDLRAERNIVVETVNDLRTIDPVPEVELADVAETVVEDTADEAEAPEAEETDEATASDEAVEDSEPVIETDAGDSADTIEQEAPVSETETDAVAVAEDLAGGDAHVASADRPVAPTHERPKVAYIAGAGQSAFAQGVELDSQMLADAWESRRTSIRPGAEGGIARAVVANLPGFEQTKDLGVELLSRSNTVERNDALIAEAVEAWEAKQAGAEVPAHMAAICDPLDIIRDIPEDGNNSTPFSDLFPSRPMSRLGFTYTPASALSVAASGVNVWTESDQGSVDETDPSTWKPAVHIECSSPTEVKAEELVTAVTVDNSTEMSSPEKVREFMAKLATARAREREQYLIGKFDGEAAAYTYGAAGGTDEGTFIQTMRAILGLLPVLTYGERLNEQTYTGVLEPHFVNKLKLDAYAVGEKEAAEDPVGFIERETGVRFVTLRDFATTPSWTTGASGAIADFADADVIRMVPAGHYIYGATGEQSTGWQTDPQLARQNRMQAFSSEWLLMAKHGVAPSVKLTLTSAASGVRMGTVTPS